MCNVLIIALYYLAIYIIRTMPVMVLIVLHEATNHVDNPLHCPRRLPFAAYQRRQCMECTKQIRGSIYKNELF